MRWTLPHEPTSHPPYSSYQPEHSTYPPSEPFNKVPAAYAELDHVIQQEITAQPSQGMLPLLGVVGEDEGKYCGFQYVASCCVQYALQEHNQLVLLICQ